jgi:hypothetical protein
MRKVNGVHQLGHDSADAIARVILIVSLGHYLARLILFLG